MTLWNKYAYGLKNPNTNKERSRTPRACKICGEPVYKGDICPSCKKFIDKKRLEERTRDNAKRRN